MVFCIVGIVSIRLEQKSNRKSFNENLNKKLANIYRFSSHDINRLILVLRKDFYLSEYINDWKKHGETLLPEKKGNSY